MVMAPVVWPVRGRDSRGACGHVRHRHSRRRRSSSGRGRVYWGDDGGIGRGDGCWLWDRHGCVWCYSRCWFGRGDNGWRIRDSNRSIRHRDRCSI